MATIQLVLPTLPSPGTRAMGAASEAATAAIRLDMQLAPELAREKNVRTAGVPDGAGNEDVRVSGMQVRRDLFVHAHVMCMLPWAGC